MNTTSWHAAILGGALCIALALVTDADAQHARAPMMMPGMTPRPIVAISPRPVLPVAPLPIRAVMLNAQSTLMNPMRFTPLVSPVANPLAIQSRIANHHAGLAAKNNAMAVNSMYGLAMQNYGMNPYLPMQNYGMNPYMGYMSANSYMGSAGTYGGGTYGGGTYGAEPDSGAYKAIASKTATPSSTATMVDSLGVPTVGGKIVWPLGLRTLAPAPKAEALRHQLDSMVPSGASPGASIGSVQAALQASAQLRNLLHKHRADFAEHTFHEADQFLDNLDAAVKMTTP